MASGHWRKSAAEFALITLSILLAFSLDAWWEDRAELRDLRGGLVALRVEFTRAQTELARAREVIEDASQLARRFRERVGPNPTATEVDSLKLVVGCCRGTTSDLPEGVLRSLLADGSLRAASSFELRARLAEWPAHVANYTTVEGYLNDHLSALRDRVFDASVVPPPQWLGLNESNFDFDGESILSDPWFANQLWVVINATDYVLEDNAAMSAKAEELKRLIDEELMR